MSELFDKFMNDFTGEYKILSEKLLIDKRPIKNGKNITYEIIIFGEDTGNIYAKEIIKLVDLKNNGIKHTKSRLNARIIREILLREERTNARRI